MLRTASESPHQPGAASEDDDRRPLWWYARVIRRHCPEGGRLIEYGCRGGRLLDLVADDFEAFGYDEDPILRQRCRAAVPDAVILEEWEAAEAESFDVVVALDCGLPPQLAEWIVRLAEKVNVGGLLFLVAPNPGGLAHWLKGHSRLAGGAPPNRGDWMALMRKADMRVVDIESDGLWDAPYLPLIPAILQRAMCDVPVAVQGYWPISRSLWPAAAGESLLIAARKGS